MRQHEQVNQKAALIFQAAAALAAGILADPNVVRVSADQCVQDATEIYATVEREHGFIVQQIDPNA